MLGLAAKLANLGVLGINRRNAEYTLIYNSRRLYPLVDNKLRTKQLALDAGIPVPELYGVVETERLVRELQAMLKPYQDFVIKPAQGSGGDGILVIADRAREKYRSITGVIVDQTELDHHVFNILSGLYSLGGQPDEAMIEYRVQFDASFETISYLGVPDIRIIVFQGVPVMAMMRLPTRLSGGKANLHVGGIGVGIDMAAGVTLSGVWRQEVITEHPDTAVPIHGFPIPRWETLLEMAAHCAEITGLGYLGVDLVLDRFKGPLLLELNARPGLGIQIANRAGLIPRLELIKNFHEQLTTLAQRLAFAREHFGAA